MKQKKITNLVSFLILLFITSTSFSFEKFQWSCSDNNCNLYAILNNGKKILASEGWTENYKSRTAFKHYNNDLGVAILGCGNNCSYSIFVNFKTGEKSNPLYDVLAINPAKGIVVLPDRKDKTDNTLNIIRLFNSHGKIIKIERQFYQGADISAEVKFLTDNKIQLNYDIDEEGNSKKEIFTIKYKNLEPVDVSLD
ncbi:MAG: hypothetical protein HY939_01170 [Gammaproteobacteria bacterium]|nr:hypothetical protein [Gammaproteobacteria bacterium]